MSTEQPGDGGRQGDQAGQPFVGQPGPVGQPGAEILTELESVLRSRRANPPPESYSATLVSDPERATRKIMEEAFELCVELGRARLDEHAVTSECADLMFHVLAGLVGAGVPVADVWERLDARRRAARDRGEQTGAAPEASA